MTDDKEELLKEINRLRGEIQQLREVVNSLVTMVMDIDEAGEENEPPFRPRDNDFTLLN